MVKKIQIFVHGSLSSESFKGGQISSLKKTYIYSWDIVSNDPDTLLLIVIEYSIFTIYFFRTAYPNNSYECSKWKAFIQNKIILRE